MPYWDGQEPEGTPRSAQRGNKETAGQSGLELAMLVCSSSSSWSRVPGHSPESTPVSSSWFSACWSFLLSRMTVSSCHQSSLVDTLNPASRKRLGHEIETYGDSILPKMLKKKNLVTYHSHSQDREGGFCFNWGQVKIIDWLMDFFFPQAYHFLSNAPLFSLKHNIFVLYKSMRRKNWNLVFKKYFKQYGHLILKPHWTLLGHFRRKLNFCKDNPKTQLW